MIGYLPDVPGFYKWMTATEYLELSAKLFGLPAAVRRERIETLLELAGLDGVDTKVGGYSRGMKQRLGVAQALINSPRLLLLDEPTSALDPIGRREVLEMIAALAGRTTVFFSTHILADVERVCDTVAVLAGGRVVEQAGIDELKARHGGAHRVVIEVDDTRRLQEALAAEAWAAAVTRDGREAPRGGRRPRGGLPTAARARGSARAVPAPVRGGRGLPRGCLRRPGRRGEAVSGLSMRGFGAFAAKEMLETRKTWRLWVLPGVLVFLGLTTPIMAAVTPAILRATAQRQPGVVIHFPPPTSVDAYLQFMGNLAQLALLVVIITGAAAVAGERRAGTAVLVLTKPLSRAAFVWAKVVANLAILIIATALGAALCIAVTILLFDTAHIAAFLESVALWLALAAMFVCLMVFLSAALDRQAAAAGAGLAVYAAIFAMTGFPLLRDRSPAGLLAANDALLKGRDAALAQPLVATLVLAVVFLIAAAWAFRRKEL